MRTQRSVVVGDPLQIEPVVTLPEHLTRAICREYQVDPDLYNAPECSVQTLADATTAYEAQFETALGERTVGVPLLVHRRCSEPMFSIANEIAYNLMMVSAKQPHPSPIMELLGPSCWIDITDGMSQDKWSQTEGDAALELLFRLKAELIEPDLYLITPFRIVQFQLRSLILSSKLLEGWVEEPHHWVNQRVGTVHTVQGREAEAVIFVLGAPSIAEYGARSWAGSRPNLLNVAVTRAKEALYVIGNRQLWKQAGVFEALSRHLGE